MHCFNHEVLEHHNYRSDVQSFLVLMIPISTKTTIRLSFDNYQSDVQGFLIKTRNWAFSCLPPAKEEVWINADTNSLSSQQLLQTDLR